VNELFGIAMWAALLLKTGAARVAARDVFGAQSVRLAHVMRTLRQGLVPVALIVAGFAPASQAHSMPGPVVSGSSFEEQGTIYEVPYDGISLDEAVRMAEAQYRARVVRTDVQDEDGRKVYVLKLLSDGGRVITVRIDAATGRMR
jgi:hypothetical protein